MGQQDTFEQEELELGAPLVAPDEAAQRVAAGATLVDVRGSQSRARNGGIPAAIAADRNRLDAQFLLDSPEKFAEITDWDQEIIIVCGSLRGSDPVARGLRERGFTNVTQVDGGFSAWQEAGNETAPPTDPETA